MRPELEIARFLPEALAESVRRLDRPLLELRLRTAGRAQLVYADGDLFVGNPIAPQELRSIAIRMMEHSYYSREDELRQGYFTMRNGCRVGVCGSYAVLDGHITAVQAIGSLCVRIARELPGCAEELVREIADGGAVENALLISRPGFGKTTLLRDAARLLSEAGYRVGIADERHEIAACRDGVPTLNVGPRTDVADGCPKAEAMKLLIRSMSPEIIVTDEIGDAEDARSVHEAARRGIAVLASAHAACLDDLKGSAMMRELMRGRIFRRIFLLDGVPGRISDVYRADAPGEAADGVETGACRADRGMLRALRQGAGRRCGAEISDDHGASGGA